MGIRKSQPCPPQPIRVVIIGDHPWADNFGWIEPSPEGVATISVMGTPMVKVRLDRGEECYAEKKHLRKIERPVSPSPPRIRRADRLS